MQTPPARLLGIPGVSSPKYHSTELVADLREDPVPTTSPTNATGRPLALTASICSNGPVTPGSLGSIPSRGSSMVKRFSKTYQFIIKETINDLI